MNEQANTPHDPGGKVRLPLPVGVTGSARLSACGRYRPLLFRRWGERADYALWIGMNPSTAEASADDPTVKREWTYTRHRLALSAYAKANVMDYRATHPKALLAPGIEPQSRDNRPAIMQQARAARFVILAFGALPNRLRGYAAEIVGELEAEAIPLFCLGFTKDGSPRHPLYLRQDSPLLAFPRGSYRAE